MSTDAYCTSHDKDCQLCPGRLSRIRRDHSVFLVQGRNVPPFLSPRQAPPLCALRDPPPYSIRRLLTRTSSETLLPSRRTASMSSSVSSTQLRLLSNSLPSPPPSLLPPPPPLLTTYPRDKIHKFDNCRATTMTSHPPLARHTLPFP